MPADQSHTVKLTAAAALQSVLFGLWPILLIYTITLGDYTPEQLVEPIVFVGLMNLTIWALLWCVYKDASRAAVIVSILSLANFFYLPLADLLSGALKVFGLMLPDQTVLAAYLVILATLLWTAHNGKAGFGDRAIAINSQALVLPAVSIVALLCALNIFNIVGFESKESVIVREMMERSFSLDQKLSAGKTSKTSMNSDVYYIVIDGFANSATLKNLLGYDNSDFIDYLKKNDFYVAEKSCSNHDRTIFSVTSSLNMDFMTPLADKLGAASVDSYVPLKLLRENRVMKMFKGAGYRIINVCSGFCPTDYMPSADQNIRSGWGTGFNMSLLHLTLVGALEPYLHLVENEYASTRLAPMRRAAEIAHLQGPKFVLIHCLLTHPPLIFDENGNHLPLSKQLLAAPYIKEPYVGQLKFTEKKLKELIDAICSTDKNAIVILQSDHGSACTDWHDSKQFSVERMRILNAYRVPEKVRAKLYETITPVNTFRILLADMLGADLHTLEDRSYIAIPPAEQYKFQEVTKALSESWK